MSNTNVNNVNIVMGGQNGVQQRPWLLRAIYFLTIGFWLTAIWLNLAYLIALTIIGLPVAQTMFAKTNAVLTLHRSA